MIKINPSLFKNSMSKFATGITIITINNKNIYLGKTVNSFSAVSLKPPLVLFSLDKKSSSLKYYKNSSFLGINLLANKQKKISNYFSTKNPKWNDTKYYISRNNIPMIKDCLVNLDCKSVKTINQGDHIIFICEIIEVLINDNKKPLVYFNSKYL